MGGPHVTEVPDEALGRDGGPRHADAIALGEADETWPQIVEDAARGELKDVYESVMQMKFVESLGAGVRLRPVAERPRAGSYWDSGASNKLARCISTFACTGDKRRRLVPQVRQSISRTCAITHIGHFT